MRYSQLQHLQNSGRRGWIIFFLFLSGHRRCYLKSDFFLRLPFHPPHLSLSLSLSFSHALLLKPRCLCAFLLHFHRLWHHHLHHSHSHRHPLISSFCYPYGKSRYIRMTEHCWECIKLKLIFFSRHCTWTWIECNEPKVKVSFFVSTTCKGQGERIDSFQLQFSHVSSSSLLRVQTHVWIHVGNRLMHLKSFLFSSSSLRFRNCC